MRRRRRMRNNNRGLTQDDRHERDKKIDKNCNKIQIFGAILFVILILI